MYRLPRDQSLQKIQWNGTSRHQLEYIDAWKYENISVRCDDNFRSGFLHDSQVAEWLALEVSWGLPILQDRFCTVGDSMV